MLKVFGSRPDQNEASDMQVSHYFNLAIAEIEKEAERLQSSQESFDVMRLHLEVLLTLLPKYPIVGHLGVRSEDLSRWKTIYFDWYDRNSNGIPLEFRGGVKESAENLFFELEKIKISALNSKN